MCHFEFDCNSAVCWANVMLHIPVETGMNTAQFTNLMARSHHNCVISYVTKF